MKSEHIPLIDSAEPLSAQPKCVKDYELRIFDGNESVTLCRVKGNYLRQRIHHFPVVVSKNLRLHITATNGDPSARVYEIRVYNQPENFSS